MNYLTASELHSTLGDSGWLSVLQQLGVPAEYLVNRHGPCLLCGGKDRYRFDNKGRGAYICAQCGAGDGFRLLGRFHGWDFRETRRRVIEAAGLSSSSTFPAAPRAAPRAPAERTAATPTRRVVDLRRGTCEPASVPDVVAYLTSRAIWPLPVDCSLRAHASVEYWEGRDRLGRFPALVADVLDVAGELVTAHVTYLQNGMKLAEHEPRKLLGKLEGRTGCAVRLMPLDGDTLRIGEGIETCLAAHRLEGIPVWAALNTSLLAKFEPPAGVRTLVVFADRDVPGLEAACKLFERLQGRVHIELRVPAAPHKDWNDVLLAEVSRG